MNLRSPSSLSTLLLSALSLSAHAASLDVSQDGWVDFSDGDVKEEGTGNRLNVATPSPAAAFQYSRLAYFGFDTSAVDLEDVQTVNFSATLADDVVASYAGATVRFYLVANSIPDAFEEGTLTDANAPGLTIGNLGTGLQTAGLILGEVTLSDTPASEEISVRFSASAVADLINDDNGFVTIVAENLSPNNAGYSVDDSTGLGFKSKESGSGATLTTGTDFTVSTTAAQDAFVDFGDTEPADGGVGTRLSLATPNPSNSTAFTRVAYFGFSLDEVDLTGVGAATFRAQLAGDIVGYEGATVRFYLVQNDLADSFDETTLIDTNAPGLTVGDVIAAQQIEGFVLGDAVIRPGINPFVAVNFPADAFENISDDTNEFLTVVAEVRSPNNAGYGDFTGVGFSSKEDGNPASLLFGPAVIDGGSYGDFISSFGLSGNDAEPGTDFDGDGQSNLVEFALGSSNPASASSTPFINSFLIDVEGEQTSILVATFPLGTVEDTGVVVDGSLALTNPDLGVSYTIDGGVDLITYDDDIEGISGVDFSGLPAAPAGFEYRAFTFSDPSPKAFFRISTNLIL